MKKVLSILLVITMVFSLVIPASAADYILSGSDIPVITIYGDGRPIYDTEGNKIFEFSEILNMLGSKEDSNIIESAVNVLQPFLMEGIINDEWDNYYDALENEFSELFAEARYDCNGENYNGSDISKELRQQMVNDLNTDKKLWRGSYHAHDYHFCYDWRQDPLKTADELHLYISKLKETTNCDKVSILTHCLGTSIVLAYISKYGTDDLHGVSFDGSIADGAEIISESISGKFRIDLDAINRLLADLKGLGQLDLDDFESLGQLNLNDFISSSIDLAAKTCAVAGFEFEETEIYGKLVQGVTSALAISTFFTWPGYWALVTEEDFEDALVYVFGEEGSDKRAEYAKLIEKIQNYHEQVTKNIWSIMQELKTNDVKVGVVAKYGFQIIPIIESSDAIADQFASVTRASFGATTTSIYETFSDEYIAQRKAEGKEKYISADKHIDASTCFFPDSTWFTKGISHSDWTHFEQNILFRVITADRQLTVDDFEYSQFIVYDNEKAVGVPMTEENCNTEDWKADKDLDQPEDKGGKIFSVLYSLVNWLVDMVTFLINKFSK